MNIDFRLAAGALALMFTAVSCSDDDKWEPGPADHDSMTVYFEQLPQYTYTLEADDDHVIPVTVSRAEYSEAASIPVEVTACPEGVVLPTAIDFEAGERSKTFNIDCSDMAPKTTAKVEMTLDPAYTSVYGAGSSSLDLTINTLGGWVPVSDTVRYKFDVNYTSYMYTTLYVLDGTTRFKFENFLNSGVDFVFTLGEKQSNNRRYIIPEKNYLAVDGNLSYGWEFWDDELAEYPVCYPVAGKVGIEYMSFYYGQYNYFNFDSGNGKMSYVYCDFTDGTSNTVNITFSKATLLFDPFEESAE